MCASGPMMVVGRGNDVIFRSHGICAGMVFITVAAAFVLANCFVTSLVRVASSPVLSRS